MAVVRAPIIITRSAADVPTLGIRFDYQRPEELKLLVLS